MDLTVEFDGKSMSAPAPIVVVFSKEQIRQRKLGHFLKTFGRDALPEGDELAGLMNRFQFIVDGYNDDPQELYSIPEVREFYQHFHKVWPYWFYFCELGSNTLTMMVLCLLPNISAIKRLGEPNSEVDYDQVDLLNFVEKNFISLNEMMERAGMSDLDIGIRSREISRHFDL